MNVTQAITQVMSRMDNVGATDSENATRRTRYLEWLGEAAEEIRDAAEWRWKYRTSGSISVAAADAYASLPSDFNTIGLKGRAYRVSDGKPMTWVSEQELMDLRRAANGSTDVPDVYSIFDIDGTTGDQRIQLPPLSADVNVAVYYVANKPTLDESGNVDNLKLAIPAQYHQSVVIPLLRHKTQMSKGDARSSEWLALHEKGLNRAIRLEFPVGKHQARTLRSFFGA